MKRSMMQVYVNQGIEALKMYEHVFSTKANFVYFNDDQTLMHAELNVFGQVIALSERNTPAISGNTMQFCFQFKEDEKQVLQEIYARLAINATVHHPLGKTFYSDFMFDLVDAYGVAWCMFI